jgi:hypothetical protein
VSATGISATGFSNVNGMTTGNIPTANIFAATIMDIIDYSSTTKRKTIRYIAGADINAAQGLLNIGSASSPGTTTTAITSIQFKATGGNTINSGTKFALYGIKG